MHPESAIPPRQSSPWRRVRRSRRRPPWPPWLPWLVVLAGVISAAVIFVIGVFGPSLFRSPHWEWEETSGFLAMRGERLTVDAFDPMPIPADQNFFEAPVFQAGSAEFSLIESALNPGHGVSTAALLAPSDDGKSRASLDTIARRLVDAGVTNPQTDYLLAGDRILAGFAQLNLDFASLRSAADRGMAQSSQRLSINDTPPAEFLPTFQALADWLAIRAIACVSIGRSTEAAADLLLIARLADALANEPFLDAQQVRWNLIEMFCSGVMTGLQREVWSADDLPRFQFVLNRFDPVEDWALAIRAARARLNSQVQQWLEFETPDSVAGINQWLGPVAEFSSIRDLRLAQSAVNVEIQAQIAPHFDTIPSAAKWNPDAEAAVTKVNIPAVATERLKEWKTSLEAAERVGVTVSNTATACQSASAIR